MGLGVLVEHRVHDGHDDTGVLRHQGHDVLVVPVVESSFRHLPARSNKQKDQTVAEGVVEKARGMIRYYDSYYDSYLTGTRG